MRLRAAAFLAMAGLMATQAWAGEALPATAEGNGRGNAELDGGMAPDLGEGVTLDLGEGVTLRLNRIPAGEFIMGSPPNEQGRRNVENQRPVTVSKPFYMGIHPVTQEQYQAVMGANPSNFKEGPDAKRRPVEQVSWNDAMEFCRRLSERTGRSVRLPTEAEWEYACRAGTATASSFGDTLQPDQANFGQRHNGTTPVGTFPANAWGLFDMLGNVWEWCADWSGPLSGGPVTDPKGPETGASRILRGGSWLDGAGRSADRIGRNPYTIRLTLGFRVALD